ICSSYFRFYTRDRIHQNLSRRCAASPSQIGLSSKELELANPKDAIKHIIVLMLENRSFDHMFGYLNVDQPRIPGDKIDNLTGDESNVDDSGNDVPVSMDARFAGDYRVDPGHHFP